MNTEKNKDSKIKTTNPATNKVEKTFDEMTDTQIQEIFENADKAYQSWKNTSFAERAELLNKVASIMRNKKEELARLCSIEMGKLYQEGLWEVEVCASIFEYYAKKGEEFLADEPLETKMGKAFISYEPMGVIFSVQPWNFPFYQITRGTAPNIMAGNTIVMKQASNIPQCAAIMEQIFDEARAPKGVYTNLFVSGAKASEIISNPYIKGVTFTGSEKSGASIAEMAGKNIKKTLLELGGSDPFVVMEDVEIDQVAEMAAKGRLTNMGQICTSPKRIIVPESIADQFIEKAKQIYQNIKIGDPLNPDTQMGPLVSVEARDKVLEQVQDSVKAGATLIYGGEKIEREGAYMQPTILTDIKPDSVAYRDEIFGPVLCIFKAKDEENAIRIANDSRFGLGGSVIGKDVEKAVALARRIETGMVYINTVTGVAAELPFGGVKDSGYGREQSKLGIKEFVNPKLICIPKQQ